MDTRTPTLFDPPIDVVSRARYRNLLIPNLPKAYDKQAFIDKLRQIGSDRGLPVDLLPALVHQESKGDPLAVSNAGAMGWGQLMPNTAKELNVDPNSIGALHAAASYLRELQNPKRFQNVDLDTALQRYNAGANAVGQSLLGKRKLKQETIDYPSKIREAMTLLQEDGIIYE